MPLRPRLPGCGSTANEWRSPFTSNLDLTRNVDVDIAVGRPGERRILPDTLLPLGPPLIAVDLPFEARFWIVVIEGTRKVRKMWMPATPRLHYQTRANSQGST